MGKVNTLLFSTLNIDQCKACVNYRNRACTMMYLLSINLPDLSRFVILHMIKNAKFIYTLVLLADVCEYRHA